MRTAWIRHGETAWNKEKRVQGQSDVPLNAEGLRQAEALAKRLYVDQDSWTQIVSSDLSRASVTAEMIAERLELPITYDIRLRERSFGLAEGMTREEMEAKWGVERDPTMLGIETAEAIWQRVSACLLEHRSAAEGDILFVTHGGIIVNVLEKLLPGSTEQGFIDNTSITILEWSNGDLCDCTLYGCLRHLTSIK